MAISRSNKDQEKRLAALKRQLYGNMPAHQSFSISEHQKNNKRGVSLSDTPTRNASLAFGEASQSDADGLTHSPRSMQVEAGRHTDTLTVDTHYLQKDLLKISLLSSIIIAIQLSLKLVLKI